jgi:hypothetical protein
MTMIELAIALVLTSLLLYALHSTLQSSIRGRRAVARDDAVMRLARDYMDRLTVIPFGNATDPAPAPDQLTELFDGDGDLGNITLHQVRVPATSPGRSFSVDAGGSRGRWQVKVSDDLNGDGSVGGPREGRPDLLRLEIRCDGRLQLATLRAAAPEATTRD